MDIIDCDVCVIGCGSGGIGAALAAAERGARVIVVDKNQTPGGTVTMSWVLNWEPSCGNSLLTRRLWSRMRSYPDGAPEQAFTTRRVDSNGKRLPGMPFEGWAYVRAVDTEFARFENLAFFRGFHFVSSRRDGRRIVAVTVHSAGTALEIRAKQFIDASADIVLCREAGCGWSLGSDARSDYGEPDAPATARDRDLNEVNWLFRVRPADRRVGVEDAPFSRKFPRPEFAGIPLPNGDLVVNICGQGIFDPSCPDHYGGVIAGQWRLAYDKYRWYVLKGLHPRWSLIGFAPEIGVRETYRLKARYVLNENDIIAGYDGQRQRDFVAATDHPLDVHGTDLHDRFPPRAYGIPFACLQTREYDNLLAACRGLGVSHIAAGSCRLSRTMMVVGEAAGRAAARAAATGKNPADFDAADIAEYESPVGGPVRELAECRA